ncbi:MAG TPA: VWA domain-containing protein, partial [Polyangiaceae bacterium]|nr:VWA domain-containing protein [Polyangiaceae bacterium]
MSFVTALALAVGLFVTLPFIAHLLRRGKTEEFEFPPAALVPEKPITARQRSRLEDRVLLSLRALAVLALAVLGATPLVRCSRLSVDRPAGASIALALVIDDSHSMRSQVSEGQRWELALSGARQLLASARTGDAIAVVLAGRPARVALSPTSDLELVKKTLNDLHVTDRSTDLGNAVRLGRSMLAASPQGDKRIIVLSDLADATWSSNEIAVSAPLTVLREATDNCAITEATRQGDAIEAQIACTSSTAAQNRTLARAAAEQPSAAGAGPSSGAVAAASGQLAARPGLQSVRLSLSEATQDQELTLSGSDADPSDDRATITGQVSALTVGVLADPAKAAVITGGATVIEQALGALDNQIIIKPMSMLPDSVKQLEPFAALVIDDPPGLGPEARVALELWVKRGGVVLGLLGPAVQLAQLSSNLEPFTTGGQWQRLSAPLDARDQGATWLALEPGGLQQLSRAGRVRLDGVEIAGSQVALRWQDDVPLLLERTLGAGSVLTLGLPAAV